MQNFGQQPMQPGMGGMQQQPGMGMGMQQPGMGMGMQQPGMGMGMQQPGMGMGMGMQQPGMGMGMQQPGMGMGMGMQQPGMGMGMQQQAVMMNHQAQQQFNQFQGNFNTFMQQQTQRMGGASPWWASLAVFQNAMEVVELMKWFAMVDTDKSGQISPAELARALSKQSKAREREVPVSTAHLLLRVFDYDRSGSIGFQEFCVLHKFIMKAQASFFAQDMLGTGSINLNQCVMAMNAVGFQDLNQQLIGMIMYNFDKKKKGSITLSTFMEMCALASLVRTQFQIKDTQRQGRISLSFPELLMMSVALKT